MNFCEKMFSGWNIFLLINCYLFDLSSGQSCILSNDIIQLTEWTGIIRSPVTINGTYPADQTCVWNIQLPEGTRVKLDITQVDLEHLHYTEQFKYFCLTDYIQINVSNNEVLRECRKPRTWISNTNDVNITFHSDNSIQNKGFVIHYAGICGQHFDSPNKSIFLRIPRLHDNTTIVHCNWSINLAEHQVPGIHFTRRGKPYLFDESSWKVYTDGKPYTDIRISDSDSMINISENVLKMTITYDGVPSSADLGKESEHDMSALEIRPVGPSCEDDIFTYNNIEILFPKTAAGINRTVPCPGIVDGVIIRQCLNTDGQSVWSRPDLTHCVNPVIIAIDRKVSEFKQKSVIHKKDVLGEMRRLYNATSSIDSLQLFPGDMLVSTNIVGKVSDLVTNTTHDTQDDFKDVAQSYADVVGSIIDMDKQHIWKTIQFEMVENKMASILESVENLSANIAKRKLKDQRNKRTVDTLNKSKDQIHVNSKYVEFSITAVDSSEHHTGDVRFSLGQNTSSIMFSSSVLEVAHGNTKNKYVQLYNGRFSSIAGILSTAKNEQNKYQSTNESEAPVVNSDIISSKVLNVPEENFQSLVKPVTITFQLQNSTLYFFLEQKCVFMNMSARNSKYRWSTDGCHVDWSRSNATQAVCVCSHLTNFAVLMDVFDVSDIEDAINYKILSYISYFGGGLSIICCVIAITVYEYFRLKKERVRIHEQFAISIIMVQLVFLVGIDRTENKYVCMSIAILLHYCLLSMFCWMLVEGFHLYVMLVKVFKTNTNFKKYLIVGWGAPAAIVCVSASIFHDKYGSAKVCWLSHEMLLAAFVPAVGFVIIVNTIILLMVLRITMRSMASSPKYNSEDKSVIRSGLKAAAILLPLLGLTWTFGFLTVNNKETIIFTYLFTFLNSMQGVFFFFFHCLFSVDVQNAYHRHSYRKSISSFTYSSKTATGRKNSDWNSHYSNDSKSSSHTNVTDVSSADKRSSRKVDVEDRIHRNPDMFREVWLKENISNPRNLFRSYSDGVPYWKQNDHQLLFRRSLSNIDSIPSVNPYDINSPENIQGTSTSYPRIPRVSTRNLNTQHFDHVSHSENNDYINDQSTYSGYQNHDHQPLSRQYPCNYSTQDFSLSNGQTNDRLYLTDTEFVHSSDNDDVFLSHVPRKSENSVSSAIPNSYSNKDRSLNFLEELKRKRSSLRKT